MKKYDMYEDPGHAWCKIPKKELEELGIANEISGYSYMRGDYAYLEEDGDFSKFFYALEKKHNVKIDINEFVRVHFSNKQSKIRGYAPYKVYSKDEENQLSDLRERMIKSRNWTKGAINKIKNAGLSHLIYWQTQYNF